MKVHEHNAGIDKENWKAEFALHLGQYANHERLHDVSFSVWAEHFIDVLLKQERTRILAEAEKLAMPKDCGWEESARVVRLSDIREILGMI